jgi:hypothetical protein
VPTERQLTANRQNARRSTGPRSRGGKERASRNSYRHGLTTPLITTQQHAKRVEALARKIAADATDFVTLEHARSAAEAEFGIARVRQAKIALIEPNVGVWRIGAAPALSVPTRNQGIL